jgi:hypothetical protein
MTRHSVMIDAKTLAASILLTLCITAGADTTSKKPVDYSSAEWPRAGSALKMLRMVQDPASQYEFKKRPAYLANSHKACKPLIAAVRVGKFNELVPTVVTDDPGHPALARYNKSCPPNTIMLTADDDIPVKNFLTELIGQYNYRIYELPSIAKPGQPKENLLCADAVPDPVFKPGAGCFFYEPNSCDGVRYKKRPPQAGAVGSALSPKGKGSTSNPYGFSVLFLQGRHFLLTADATSVVEGTHVSFNLTSLNKINDESCLWSYLKRKD